MSLRCHKTPCSLCVCLRHGQVRQAEGSTPQVWMGLAGSPQLTPSPLSLCVPAPRGSDRLRGAVPQVLGLGRDLRCCLLCALSGWPCGCSCCFLPVSQADLQCKTRYAPVVQTTFFFCWVSHYAVWVDIFPGGDRQGPPTGSLLFLL